MTCFLSTVFVEEILHTTMIFISGRTFVPIFCTRGVSTYYFFPTESSPQSILDCELKKVQFVSTSLAFRLVFTSPNKLTSITFFYCVTATDVDSSDHLTRKSRAGREFAFNLGARAPANL